MQSTGEAGVPVQSVDAHLEEEKEEDESKYPTGVALWAVLVPVTIGYFLYFLDTCIVATASPAITLRFDSLIDIGWYGGAYQLGNSAVRPLTGKMYSHFNTKWTYLAFFFLFELGSLICGAAVSSPMFIFGRALAGAGAAGIGTGALVIISCVLPVRKQAKALGMNMGVGQLGVALGPILGGVFTEYVSWRWCFYINLPLGGAFVVLLFFSRIPEATVKKPAMQVLGTAIKSLDLVGFALVAPATIMFLLGLQYGGTLYPWTHSIVIGLIVGGVATFAVFLVWEYYQGDAAMIPLALLKTRIIWCAAATLFFLLGSILTAEYYLAMYFQTVKGNTPLQSGIHILPATLGLAVFAITAGVLSEKLGYYLPWNLGGAALSAIGYGLMSTFKPGTATLRWVGYQVLYGIGSGAMVSMPYVAVQNCVSTPQIPLAMTLVLFCQDIGAATWLVAANAIFNNGLQKELEQRSSEIGIDPAFIVRAGATSIRQIVQGDRLAAALEAYTGAITHVMYLGIALCCATFLFASGTGWKDIRVAQNLPAIKGSPSESSGNVPLTNEKGTDTPKQVDSPSDSSVTTPLTEDEKPVVANKQTVV
ncbi:MFS general substrate transporter [Phaeosphaeriaceae sp. SRC1lsM3a]|nr:MFS general substrate transporter [Stagonospora sp. SRC1lsM3a]